MPNADPLRILVNLPTGFHTADELAPEWTRLDALGDARHAAHNTADEMRDDLAWADAVLMWSWPTLADGLLNDAPRLRFAGHIDLSQSAARAELGHGLTLSQSRGGWSPAVAELALTLTLAGLRRTSAYHAAMRAGTESWAANLPDDFPPAERELTGRPVGIVGFGRVGRRVAELLAPFRCPLHVHDPYLPDDALAAAGATRGTVRDLAERCDVLILSAASNPGTKKLIDAEVIDAMRPDALLVNVARAALVDTDALVAHLQRGDLFAAIDVFDEEPLPADHPLRACANADLTPHRAGGLRSSVVRCVRWLIDDLEHWHAGRPLANPLTEAMIPALDQG